MPTNAENEYADALYDLSQLICRDDPKAQYLQMKILREGAWSNEALIEELYQHKANLIRAYTQQHERGGLN